MLVFDDGTTVTKFAVKCFNPCFSGCWSSTPSVTAQKVCLIGFNPCFSGCWSSTINTSAHKYGHAQVSILVLVDVGLRPV